MWESLDFLNTLVDDSDPDIDFTQIEHAMQTAEAIRAANQPRWFIVTGLVHDLGKILCLFGEPQWAVVGDTFPVGCRWSPKIVYSNLFGENPDRHVPEYQTENGIYEPGLRPRSRAHVVGPRRVRLSRRQGTPAGGSALHAPLPLVLPLAQGGRVQRTSRTRRTAAMLKWVRAFNRYDLYSKGSPRPDVPALMPYYQELVDEFFPGTAALVARPAKAAKAVIDRQN